MVNKVETTTLFTPLSILGYVGVILLEYKNSTFLEFRGCHTAAYTLKP